MDGLSEQDRALLAFASRRWQHRGAMVEAIRRELGMSPWQYQQRVFQVCSTPAALAAEPVLVNRINRRRRRAAQAV